MIPFEPNRQQEISTTHLKIVGLGGAGANMLDRAAIDGVEGAELLALNTDVRTLAHSVAGEKIQLGKVLTKGLGAGGDPELGRQAVVEAEAEVRESLRGRKIIFLCVGLGGGTGSGAAPIVTRLAREEGAFVVVFATMPFGFEGQRRREQAETALNELAVLSNALITFDNGRMGDLVLAKAGVHEAFSAADRMISESIKAVTRLVLKPGLINVGLDDLVTALKTTRSRCLFGSGLAKGKNRSQTALKNALTSPLLDKGSLLNDSESVLVHVSGGEDMTLYEIELLMQDLTKHIPDTAHILFGAAIDESMGDAMSVTIISALPENRLTQMGRASEITQEDREAREVVKTAGAPLIASSLVAPEPPGQPATATEPAGEEDGDLPGKPEEAEASENEESVAVEVEAEAQEAEREEDDVEDEWEELEGEVEEELEEDVVGEDVDEEEWEEVEAEDEAEVEDEEVEGVEDYEEEDFDDEDVVFPDEMEEEVTAGEDESPEESEERALKVVAVEPEVSEEPEAKSLVVQNGLKAVTKGSEEEEEEIASDLNELKDADWAEIHQPSARVRRAKPIAIRPRPSQTGGQGELELDGGPKGRFEGENPNLVDGEDLDVPPYLRKRSK